MKTFFHLSKTLWVFGKIQAAKANGAKIASTGITADRNTNANNPETMPITPGTIAISTNINRVPIPKTEAAIVPPISVAPAAVPPPAKIAVNKAPQPTSVRFMLCIGVVIIPNKVLPIMFAISTMIWITK